MVAVIRRKPVKETMRRGSSKAWRETRDFVRWAGLLIENLAHQGCIRNTGGNGKSVVKVVRARDAAKSCCKQLEELAIEQGLFRKLHARGKLGSYTPSQHANDNE
jgi:hypothetical protein